MSNYWFLRNVPPVGLEGQNLLYYCYTTEKCCVYHIVYFESVVTELKFVALTAWLYPNVWRFEDNRQPNKGE